VDGRGEAEEAAPEGGDGRRRRGGRRGGRPARGRRWPLTCGPHTSAGQRERGREEAVGWAAWAEIVVGRELGWVGLAVSFFFFSFSNPNSNLLNSNPFHVFKLKF
jgi:hypothetical protein